MPLKYTDNNSKQLALSAVSWPGLGFPGSGIKALSSLSSPPAFLAFFGSFSSKAFAYELQHFAVYSL